MVASLIKRPKLEKKYGFRQPERIIFFTLTNSVGSRKKSEPDLFLHKELNVLDEFPDSDVKPVCLDNIIRGTRIQQPDGKNGIVIGGKENNPDTGRDLEDLFKKLGPGHLAIVVIGYDEIRDHLLAEFVKAFTAGREGVNVEKPVYVQMVLDQTVMYRVPVNDKNQRRFLVIHFTGLNPGSNFDIFKLGKVASGQNF